MDMKVQSSGYMNNLVSQAIQKQGQVMLQLLQVHEQVEKVQIKPLGNLLNLPGQTFEAVA